MISVEEFEFKIRLNIYDRDDFEKPLGRFIVDAVRKSDGKEYKEIAVTDEISALNAQGLADCIKLKDRYDDAKEKYGSDKFPYLKR